MKSVLNTLSSSKTPKVEARVTESHVHNRDGNTDSLFIRADLQNRDFPISIVHESGFAICKQNKETPASIGMIGDC